MKHVFMILLGFLILMSLSCSKIFVPKTSDFYIDSNGNRVEITAPTEQCVLYKVLGTNTSYYKMGLYTANYGALKAGIYTPEEAESVINNISDEVNNPAATVGSVITVLLASVAKAEKAGAPEIILITSGLDEFAGSTVPLDDCTRYKLNQHIVKEKLLITAFK
jgi:hypothetical protein